MDVAAALEHLSYLARHCAEAMQDTPSLPAEHHQQIRNLMNRLLTVVQEMEAIAEDAAIILVEADENPSP